MDTSDAQLHIATPITRTTIEVEQDKIIDHAKCVKKTTKVYPEYTIDHIVPHVPKAQIRSISQDFIAIK